MFFLHWDLRRQRAHLRRYGVFFAVCLSLAATCLMFARSNWVLSWGRGDHDDIRKLQEVPKDRPVRIEGIVTYADAVEQRFWVQDETGAVGIAENPSKYGIRAGQAVHIEATKRNPYNPAIGPSSFEFKIVKITPIKTQIKLSQPIPASFKALPDKEGTGIRVEVSGVVRQVSRDPFGRLQLAFGEAGQEASIVVAEASTVPPGLVDAKVRITGVGESLLDANGALIGKRLLAQSSRDIRLEEKTPAIVPVYTIRALYRDASSRMVHRIRLRGRVIARPNPTTLLIEDPWGTISCQMDEMPPAVGSLAEVTGFPSRDGMLIDLRHSTAKELASAESQADPSLENVRELSSVRAVRELSETDANQAQRVRVTGMITYNDPAWRQMFIQDATGGIYVKYAGSRVPLFPGELVTVTGLTNAGDFAPVIVAPKFVLSGRGHLPPAIPVTAGEAPSGKLDSQFVQLEGVIHPMKNGEEPLHLTFELYSNIGQVHVYTGPEFGDAQAVRNLVDANVRVRGVFGTVFNSRRQLVGYQLSVASAKDIEVLRASVREPFDMTRIPVGHLLRFSQRIDFRHRVKVAGSVTMVRRDFFYMQDESGGLQVRGDTSSLAIGDYVETVGYASPEGGYSPVMIDALVRRIEGGRAVAPRPATNQSVLQGQFDSQLIEVDARLLSVIDGPGSRSLVLQAGALTFNAQLDTADLNQVMPEWREGSVLRLTGVCSVKVNPSKIYLVLGQEPLGFRLLLRSPRDVQVLQAASWWTAQRALIALAALVLGILGALWRIARLRRRVHMQTAALQQADKTTKAIRDLAQAMHAVRAEQKFAARVSVPEDSELAELGVGFNAMLEQLEQRDSEKRKAEAQLQQQALTDELTGLPNRRLLSDRIAQTLGAARREHRVVAVLYIDLDGFKLVNDSLGHTVGDLLLSEVARRLRSRVRESDTVARLGGDEFTVVLTRLRARQEAELVARTLLDLLNVPFQIENHEIVISASIGISLFPENGSDGIELLQQADSAMYAAKRNGKNQLRCFSAELGTSVRERLTIEHQLRAALTQGAIDVYYQPEFEIGSHRLVRFEALARWTHATLGVIPPSKFIPIAEESGLIIPLGAYILERACTEAVKWQKSAPAPVQVAVNVSSVQFERDTFVDEVAEVLRFTGLKPSLLQIELTESVMLTGADCAASKMKQLRALGVSLAIDDFGTGYSCLSYLPKLPFDALKIDRSFVSELSLRPEIKAMVHSLVMLAHNLNMQVIVEGIETPEQLDLIRQLGGNEVQGYLLGRPTPSAQIQFEPGGGKSQGCAPGEAALPQNDEATTQKVE